MRARARTGLPRAIERAGGAAALERCAAVRTSAAARTYVAWELDLPLPGLADRPRPPVVLVRARPPRGGRAVPPLPPGAGLREAARTPDWQIWTARREGARRGRRAGAARRARLGGRAAVRLDLRRRARAARPAYSAFWKRTVTRSKPRPRSSPSSIWRVLRSAARRSAGSAAAAACSLRWAAR